MTIWDSLARSLRPMAEASLPDSAILERVQQVREAGGRITETWLTVLTDVPCRVQPAPLPITEGSVAGQTSALNRWVVVLPVGTPIVEGMRALVVGTDLDGNTWNRVLTIVAVDSPKTYEVVRTATAVDPNFGARS